LFFVFEGIDGSGKSTQARLFVDFLRRERGLDPLAVREPGGTPLGERLRHLILDPNLGEMAPETELFLFMAARSHLVRSVVVPALQAGRTVVSDRFLWSSVVYQGVAMEGGFDEVLRLGELAVAGLRPTRPFVIDTDPEVAFARVSERNRMEHRGIEYQKKVREGFLALARRFPRTSSVIDGRGAPEEVLARVLAALPPEG
jgi:dTMP kinase